MKRGSKEEYNNLVSPHIHFILVFLIQICTFHLFPLFYSCNMALTKFSGDKSNSK
jgi:ABC-type sugar transport system permease subunit